MKERFTASAVQRAVLLKHGDDPAIGPGQLMVRVFVEAADDEGLAAWQRAHQPGIEEFRRELSLRLPSARLLEFTYNEPGAARIDVPDDGSLAAEQLSGREIVTKAMELLRANYVFPDEAGRAAAAIEARLEAGEYDGLDEITLTDRVTGHLQDITGDKHLRLRLGGGPGQRGPGHQRGHGTRRRDLRAHHRHATQRRRGAGGRGLLVQLPVRRRADPPQRHLPGRHR